MTERKQMNQEQSFEKQLLADISPISPFIKQENKFQSSVVQISPFEVVRSSILSQSQSIRKTNPELADLIDEYNKKKKQILKLTQKNQTNSIVNEVFNFEVYEEQKQIMKLKKKILQGKDQLLKNEQKLSEYIQEKNQLINQLIAIQQTNLLMQQKSQQNLTKINNNLTNVSPNININFLNKQEQQSKNLYQDKIINYFETLIDKQKKHNQLIEQQSKNLKIKIKNYEQGIELKKEEIMKEKKQNEVRLTLDQIQNQQKAIQELKLWIMRINRQKKTKKEVDSHLKTFKRR